MIELFMWEHDLNADWAASRKMLPESLQTRGLVNVNVCNYLSSHLIWSALELNTTSIIRLSDFCLINSYCLMTGVISIQVGDLMCSMSSVSGEQHLTELLLPTFLPFPKCGVSHMLSVIPNPLSITLLLENYYGILYLVTHRSRPSLEYEHTWL